jgi:hypothetical protein
MAGSLDLLLGFNQTDAGLMLLLLLFLFFPVINLLWFLLEMRYAFKQFKSHKKAIYFVMPLVAALLFVESVLVDAYILLQVRM